MNTHAAEMEQVLNGTRSKSAVSVSETYWGYVISKGPAARRRATMGEVAAIGGCMFFGTAAFGQWLLPGAIYQGTILPFKISVTLMFFVFAAQLYLIARRGLTTEVQVNVKRQNVRVVRRNREGATTVTSSFAFSEIDSIYIKRSKSDFVADQMYMKPNSIAAPEMIASGPKQDLEPLLDMLQRDFRGQMQGAPRKVRDADHDTARPRARGAFATG